MTVKSHALVTGGTGFIGRSLCQTLLADGYRVTVLTRNAAKAGVGQDDRDFVEDLVELDRMPPVTLIVNLAGEPLANSRWNEARKREFFRSRVGTTEKLFDYFAGVASPPQILVSGSAIGYYGAQGSNELDEEGSYAPGFSHDLCAAWEAAADKFEALGTRVCKVRTGIVLGPGGGALASMLPLFRLGLGGPIGSGQQWMSWIHRDDLVGIILHCIEHQQVTGPINGTAPGAVTNKKFARTLGKVLRRPAVMPTPGFVLKLVFGQMAEELLLSGQNVYPKKALQTGYSFLYPELEPALRQVLGA